MDIMKSLFLLVFSLLTGCDASLERERCREGCVEGCEGGQVEFTCKYPDRSRDYEVIKVDSPIRGRRAKQSTKNDEWEDKGNRVSLYHDTKRKELRVAIRELQQQDFGEYKCKFVRRSNGEKEKVEVEVELKDGGEGCKPFIQTAYRAAPTTITCDLTGFIYSSKVNFFCREDGLVCEDIVSTSSTSVKSNGTFNLTETSSGFSVSISNVSLQHAGVYWCGLESNRGTNRTTLRRIDLKVQDITTFTRSPTIGQTLTYWCEYTTDAPIKKFICKGEDPSKCEHVVSTSTQMTIYNGRFSIKDDRQNRNISITVRDVTSEDSGTYWFGAENIQTRISRFFHRVRIIVVPPTTSKPSTSTVTSPPVTTTPSVHPTMPTTANATLPTTLPQSDGVLIIIAVAVSVAVLVLLLILALIYRRFKRSKITRSAEALNNKEERFYEEIQERPPQAKTGTARTVYATAGFPTAAIQSDSSVHFKNSCGEENAYSTVYDNKNDSECLAYSTVNHPATYLSPINPPASIQTNSSVHFKNGVNGEGSNSTVNTNEDKSDAKCPAYSTVNLPTTPTETPVYSRIEPQ